MAGFGFSLLVSNIALLILIISLTFAGYMMYKRRNNAVFDNIVIGECPDYWNMVKEGNNNVCVNVKNLGKCPSSNKMNFFMPPWTGTDSVCQKYKWANSCDLTWDGITNNHNACTMSKP